LTRASIRNPKAGRKPGFAFVPQPQDWILVVLHLLRIRILIACADRSVEAPKMPSQNEHGKLIAAAAKAALLPLGCIRKGQSRLWYSDQRFWAISIEFQPSGWSKGSYLNIAANWFWHLGPGYSLWYRPGDFIPFENAEQFKPLIEDMAAMAAREVLTMRDRFKTLANIQHYLITPPIRDGSPVHDAAVASWLIGDVKLSKTLFRRMAQWQTYGYDWEKSLKKRSAEFAAQVDNPSKFMARVAETIQQQRKLVNLPLYPECLEDLIRARAEQ
jgi:hypothetical protein